MTRPESGATHVLFTEAGYAVLWGIEALPDAYAALTNTDHR